jgi:hypothetical protein
LVPTFVQVLLLGLYRPPVFVLPVLYPPQMIISLPVHTAVCDRRGDGALVVLVAVQLFVAGLYLPPVSEQQKLLDSPPQMII